jgi:hypothetical protein
MGVGVGGKGLVIMVGRFTDYGFELPVVEVVEKAKQVCCLGRGEEICCFWSEEICRRRQGWRGREEVGQCWIESEVKVSERSGGHWGRGHGGRRRRRRSKGYRT